MNDRFKFRMYDTNVNKMYIPNDFEEVESIYECIKQQINWDLDVDYDIKFNHLEDGRFFIQCTGLKDKNGKLIYDGDILKGKKDMLCSPHSSRMVDRVGVVEIPQNMFVARCRDVKNNCTLFCQSDWVKTEVIGNIYENKELLG